MSAKIAVIIPCNKCGIRFVTSGVLLPRTVSDMIKAVQAAGDECRTQGWKPLGNDQHLCSKCKEK